LRGSEVAPLAWLAATIFVGIDGYIAFVANAHEQDLPV
jgi:hypothetical protein